jgi:sugar phosphate isomerase/epimerase
MVSIALLDRQRRQDSMDEIKRALETAEHIPISYLVLHLGVDGEEYDLRKFDAALTSLEHLGLFASQRGVRILIENIANDLSTPQRIVEFFGHTHLRGLEVCLDTGHAQLEGGVVPAIELLGKAIALVHLSDNNGMIDDHQFPGTGMIPWSPVLRALAEHSPEAILTIEARSVDNGRPPLEQARASREKLEALARES